jgi:uncharacterized protein (DUF433 family)
MDESSKRIIIDREILGGKPVIKGTRIPVYLVLELLGSNTSEKEILKEYPTLKEADIKAALLFAAKCLEKKYPTQIR